MKTIKKENLILEIQKKIIKANIQLPEDNEKVINELKENNSTSKEIVKFLNKNLEIAKMKKLPICQDTGIVVCFVEIGNQVKIDFNLEEAINEGIRRGYNKGYLRKSVVKSPFNRINTNDNTPGIVHYKYTEGDIFKIKIAPKGAGSENMSALKMFTPTTSILDIKKYIVNTIKEADGKPCPPIIVGIGIGGNFEKSAILAKEALLRDINDENSDKEVAKIENELLEEINNLNIGPMGVGGLNTALAVKINTYPCHIASLPVAINIQCHVSRHEVIEL